MVTVFTATEDAVGAKVVLLAPWANEIGVPVCSASDVSLSDEGEVPVSSVVFVEALSDNRASCYPVLLYEL